MIVYNTNKLIKNALRVSKVRNEGAIRLRVPGGHLDSKHLGVIKDLAEKFGNGTVHLTTRQGYEIPGIPLKDMAAAKKYIAEMIAEIEQQSNVILEHPEDGYPSAGTRNISACIGNRVCQFANYDTTLLAQRIEEVIYPNNYHLKVALTGCPNDCIKAHMNDIGIIGNIVPEYNKEKCIMCEACVTNCRIKVTNALSLEDCQIQRDEKYCIQCGECILKCPTGAFSRGKKLFRIIVGGRTGKKNPRLANTFIAKASEEVVLAVCRSVYSFIGNHIDKSLAKEHMGYIIDRVGVDNFRDEIKNSITLNPEAEFIRVENPGYFYNIKS